MDCLFCYRVWPAYQPILGFATYYQIVLFSYFAVCTWSLTQFVYFWLSWIFFCKKARDVVLGLSPWLPLRTKLESLVLALALKVQALALRLESLLTSMTWIITPVVAFCASLPRPHSSILCFPSTSAPVDRLPEECCPGERWTMHAQLALINAHHTQWSATAVGGQFSN